MVGYLRQHRDDPSAGVRATVFAVECQTDAEPDVGWLLRELADPNVHPGFVSALAPSVLDLPGHQVTVAAAAQPLSLSLPPPGDGDHPEVRASLVRLRESGWADRAADSDYPEKAERAQTQDDAIEAAVAVFVVNRCRLTTPIHHDRCEG